MERELVMQTINKHEGFTLIEVMVVLILLTLSFMVFLRALNTGKSVRVNSELRTVQGVILSSIENEIRSRRFDENFSSPWSSFIGKDSGENTVDQFDDIDDFHQYTISSLSEYPAYGVSVSVSYVHPDSKFRVDQNSQTNYKRVSLIISHKTLPAITDTMIISSGL